jgi:xanthine dehydrogenase accessory factor
MKPVYTAASWTEAAALLAAQGQAYVLITLFGSRGSTPRRSGTKMVASAEADYGTIGGGQLEFKALEIAADMLAAGIEDQRIEHFPLGASFGQCCGGSHTVLFESFSGNTFNIALFGAGHVGQALTGILQQLPCRLHWVDSREEQHPRNLPANVIPINSDAPAAEVNDMPAGSYYLIMTHSHQLDFVILEAVLQRGDARYIGLIGSESKWRRFQQRLEHKGYASDTSRQVRCPVGLTQVPGKRPVEVAVSIAGQIIAEHHAENASQELQQGVSLNDVKQLITAKTRETSRT